MIQAFHDKVDIHASTAARIFQIPIDSVGENNAVQQKWLTSEFHTASLPLGSLNA